MFQAHQHRTFRAVQFVSRMLGRQPRPDLDGARSSLYPVVDRSLPVWVSTDSTVWATTEDEADGIAFATRLTRLLYPGERVFVTNGTVVVWSGRGQQAESRDIVSEIDAIAHPDSEWARERREGVR